MKAWLCLGFESGLNLTSREDKDQWGLLYCLHYRETCAPTCAEHNFWAICRSQLVQVDWPVSYPLVFIHLRDVDPYNPRWTSHRMSNMQYYIITSDFGYKNLKQWSKDSLKIKYIYLFQNIKILWNNWKFGNWKLWTCEEIFTWLHVNQILLFGIFFQVRFAHGQLICPLKYDKQLSYTYLLQKPYF